jgi:hypothetical protein
MVTNLQEMYTYTRGAESTEADQPGGKIPPGSKRRDTLPPGNGLFEKFRPPIFRPVPLTWVLTFSVVKEYFKLHYKTDYARPDTEGSCTSWFGSQRL